MPESIPQLPEDSHVSWDSGRAFVEDPTIAHPPSPPGGEGASFAQTMARAPQTTAGEAGLPQAMDEEAPARAPYVYSRVIGKGGFGEVWEAEQTSLGRIVAIKRLKAEHLQRDPMNRVWLRNSFRQEALTTSNLEHPNIVPVYDLATDENEDPALAMKLVKGRGWEEMIQGDFALMDPESFLARHLPILIQVAQAVAFAHSRGIVHRDLKPTQVMVGEFGEVILMDWGLALIFDTTTLAPTTIDAYGPALPTCETASNPAGTIAFMAPEQTEASARNVGPWTDIFLLGGTLYFLLTGKTPYDSGNSTVSFMKAKAVEMVSASERVPDRYVPPELNDLAAACMRAVASERLGSVKAFIQGVEDYLAGVGKRRESWRLTGEVSQFLGQGRGDYREYSDCLAKLASAEALWQGNPEVPPLRGAVLVAFVREALANRDLTLAQLHADMMERGDEKAKVLLEVEEAVREVRMATNRRRVMVGSLAAAVVLLVVGSLWYGLASRARVQALAESIATMRSSQARALTELAEERWRAGLKEPAREAGRKALDTLDLGADNPELRRRLQAVLQEQ